MSRTWLDHPAVQPTKEIPDLDPNAAYESDLRTLSGGQQQRVGIARALAVEPDVLLLDEPLTGLDAQLKSRLQVEIRDLLDSLGVTALHVTHDQVEAMTMCDRVAVLNDGRIEQVASPAVLYHDPATEFVAEFVAPDRVELPFLNEQ